MPIEVLEGDRDAFTCRFAIVVSLFNEFVTSRLLAHAIDTLKGEGVSEEAITVAKVPGAFEIPLVARQFAASGKFDAVICLGAVIRGETPHFDFLCAEVSRGIAQAGWETGIPVVFGVITANTAEQALVRADSPERNRGAEAARTAIAMATLMKKLQYGSGRSTTGFYTR
ncbi:MAG: 6,7-dimethyl-8-ribityllumazine synthase [Nitrospirae bacterium]|nr:MAG: 6,7-dimethyl-8-ribityllumazine synthase [Nitrospirota bacterium]